jgi:hypothetical protein
MIMHRKMSKLGVNLMWRILNDARDPGPTISTYTLRPPARAGSPPIKCRRGPRRGMRAEACPLRQDGLASGLNEPTTESTLRVCAAVAEERMAS